MGAERARHLRPDQSGVAPTAPAHTRPDDRPVPSPSTWTNFPLGDPLSPPGKASFAGVDASASGSEERHESHHRSPSSRVLAAPETGRRPLAPVAGCRAPPACSILHEHRTPAPRQRQEARCRCQTRKHEHGRSPGRGSGRHARRGHHARRGNDVVVFTTGRWLLQAACSRRPAEGNTTRLISMNPRRLRQRHQSA